jgi:hypothetical protein
MIPDLPVKISKSLCAVLAIYPYIVIIAAGNAAPRKKKEIVIDEICPQRGVAGAEKSSDFIINIIHL